MLAHTGHIAVSFHRLFLGGLLPSRARFRFAGLLPIRRYMKRAQGAGVSTKFQGRVIQNGVMVGLRNRSSCKSAGSGMRDSW